MYIVHTYPSVLPGLSLYIMVSIIFHIFWMTERHIMKCKVIATLATRHMVRWHDLPWQVTSCQMTLTTSVSSDVRCHVSFFYNMPQVTNRLSSFSCSWIGLISLCRNDRNDTWGYHRGLSALSRCQHGRFDRRLLFWQWSQNFTPSIFTNDSPYSENIRSHMCRM